ncbi:MAG: SLBB domain-containing protein [Armatimonadota bacterium]
MLKRVLILMCLMCIVSGALAQTKPVPVPKDQALPVTGQATQAPTPTPTPAPAPAPAPASPAPAAATAPGAPEAAPLPPTVPPTVLPQPDRFLVPEPRWDLTRSVAEYFRTLPRFGALVFGRVQETDIAPKPEPQAPAWDLGEVQGAAEKRPQTAPQPTTVVSPNYLIGAGDSVYLEVWSRNRLQNSGTFTVAADGSLALPVIGKFSIAGRTLGQVQTDVTKSYEDVYEDLRVSLVLASQRVSDVFVLGDVQQPGKYSLPGMATVFSALYSAGGPTDSGSYRQIRVLRQGKLVQVVDLYAFLLRGESSGDIVLQPDDTVFVSAAAVEVAVAGEVRRPARYELSGPSSVQEVLAMAGGIGPLGYAPSLEVWRTQDHRSWSLLNLDAGQDQSQIKLQDGDVVLVKPLLDQPQQVVAVRGLVQRPGSYQFQRGMTVSQALRLAEGLQERADVDNAFIWRLNSAMGYDLVRFSAREAMAGNPEADLALLDRDIIEVREKVLAGLEISGQVVKPGRYPYGGGMTVRDLVAMAGGLLPGAYVDRAQLVRVDPNQKLQYLSVELAAALKGDPQANVILQDNDLLAIRTHEEMGGPREVRVEGEVITPHLYTRLEGMKVSDLIFAAGGLKPGAAAIGYRSGRSEGKQETTMLEFTGSGDKFSLPVDPILKDDDVVVVQGTGGFIARPHVVNVEGAVCRRGAYPLTAGTKEGDDTVWELLQRAGGLLPEADPNGIVVYRGYKTQFNQVAEVQQAISSLNREAQAQPGAAVSPTAKDAVTEAMTTQVAQAFSANDSIGVVIPPRQVSIQEAVRTVPIDGPTLFGSQGSEGNLRLLDGDVLVVQRKRDTVSVVGCVIRPGSVQHRKGLKVVDYIGLMGGPTNDAALNAIVVVSANGTAYPAAKRGELQPADVIIVPSRYLIEIRRAPISWWETLRGLAAAAATAILVN